MELLDKINNRMSWMKEMTADKKNKYGQRKWM